MRVAEGTDRLGSEAGWIKPEVLSRPWIQMLDRGDLIGNIGAGIELEVRGAEQRT